MPKYTSRPSKEANPQHSSSSGLVALFLTALRHGAAAKWIIRTVFAKGRWLNAGCFFSLGKAASRVAHGLLLALLAGMALPLPAFGQIPGRIDIDAETIPEAGGTSVVGVALHGPYSGPALGLAIGGGTAAGGADFVVSSSDGNVIRVLDSSGKHIGYFVTPSGSYSTAATITSVDDLMDEPEESIGVMAYAFGTKLDGVKEITLPPGNIVGLPIADSGSVNIIDNDPTPTVSLSSSDVDVDEGAVTVSLTVS